MSWGRSRDQSRFRSCRESHGPEAGERMKLEAHANAARHAVKCGVRLDPGCGVVERGVDGPARRLNSVSSRGGLDHRQFLAADRRGPRQDDQVVKTKHPAGNCLRILDQSLGSTRARSSRSWALERPGKMAAPAQGWAGHPRHPTPKATHLRRTPAPDALAPCFLTHWSNRSLCLSCDNWVLE